MIKFFKTIGGVKREEITSAVEVGSGLFLNQNDAGQTRIDLDPNSGTTRLLEVDGLPDLYVTEIALPNGTLSQDANNTNRAIYNPAAIFYLKSEIDTKFGNYYTKTETDAKFGNYYTKTESDGKYLTSSSLDNYIQKTSAARPGVTRLYRRDHDSGYSVQTHFDGAYWRLSGYDAADAAHAGVRVSVADDADTVDGQHASAFATAGHLHDDRYYTETEVNNLLNGKANSSHNHDWSHITTGVPVYATRWPTWDEVSSKPTVAVQNTDVTFTYVRAQVFYDTNDQSYYLDPTGATSLRGAGDVHLNLGKNLWIGNNADTGSRIRVHCAADGNSYIDFSGTLNLRPNSVATTYINSSGHIYGPAFYETSSRTLKEEIRPYADWCVTPALDLIDTFDIVGFYRKADARKHLNLGIIAEDTAEKTGTLFTGPDQNAFDLANTVAVLVKGMQELREENRQLRALLEA